MREMSYIQGGYSGQSVPSTLISIVPFPIDEVKPGLIPGRFSIAASPDGRPQFTVIRDAHHFVYIDESRGNLRVLNPSYDVAQAVVADYNSAQLEADPSAHPGFFWLIGEWDEDKIHNNKEAAARLSGVREIQNNWFRKIVMLADDDWQRSRQHSAISDVQRYAARVIDPENKAGREWLFVLKEEQKPKIDIATCPACESEIASTAVICRHCSCILNPEKYALMRFASSGPGPIGGVDLSKVLGHK